MHTNRELILHARPFIISDIKAPHEQLEKDPKQRRRRFRFEAHWVRADDCEQVIRSSWSRENTGTAGERVWQNIQGCRLGLLNWSRLRFVQPKKRIEKIEKEIEKLRSGRITAESKLRESSLRAELEELLSQEEVYWKQRSKEKWLREGDRNTAFFHSKATSRFKNNAISRIRDQNGFWRDKDEEIQEVISDYFGSIFRSSKPGYEDIDRVLV